MLSLLVCLAVALGVAAQGGTPARPPVMPTAEALVPCPFSPAEIEAATGLKFRLRPNPVRLSDIDGMYHAGCFGMGDGHQAAFIVEQTWADPSTATVRFNAQRRLDRNRGAEPVAGDPDGALWKAKPGDREHVLTYARGNVYTSVSLNGPPPGREDEVRRGLLGLRRLP